MKKNGIILLIVVGLLQSCADKDKLPADVLPQSKMQAVMWDLIRAADFLNNYVFFKGPPVDQAAESEKWNTKIFQMHKISKAQFDKSYAYYKQHPMLMKAVMDSISKIKVEQPVQKNSAEMSAKVDSTAKADSVARLRKIIDSSGLRGKLNRLRRLAKEKKNIQ